MHLKIPKSFITGAHALPKAPTQRPPSPRTLLPPPLALFLSWLTSEHLHPDELPRAGVVAPLPPRADHGGLAVADPVAVAEDLSKVGLLLLLNLQSRAPASSPLLFSTSGGLRKGRELGEEGRPSGADVSGRFMCPGGGWARSGWRSSGMVAAVAGGGGEGGGI